MGEPASPWSGWKIVSEANTGRIGYIAGATEKVRGIAERRCLRPLLTSATHRQAYGFGSVAADQTLALLDTKGGGLIVDGSGTRRLRSLRPQDTRQQRGNLARPGRGPDYRFRADETGTATYEPINVAYTINQTGGANGTITAFKGDGYRDSRRRHPQPTRPPSGGELEVPGDKCRDFLSSTWTTAGAPTIAWLTDPTTGEYHSGTGATGTHLHRQKNGANVMNVNTFGLGVGAGALATSTYGFHSLERDWPV